jgi:ACS family hexuronate transporter-like MFS transporter
VEDYVQRPLIEWTPSCYTAVVHPKRWRVAVLVCAAIAISYLDRQSLPVAVKAIQQDIPLTNTQFGDLTSIFLLAYALMYAGGGVLVDRLGTRRGFLAIMIFWSLACASHALATGFATLAVSRFLLGMGEGGGFPAATKVIAEWFPVADRSTAMGIVNAGTAIGAVAAPPAIAAILLVGNWRWVFVACGAAGLLWAAAWFILYEAVPASPAGRGVGLPRMRWTRLLSFRQVWGLVAAKFLTDAAWFFYISWLPKYLYDARHFDVKQVGAYAWVPYAASGIGCLLGGWFAGALIRRGRSVDLSRKLALGLSAAVMPAIVFVTRLPVEWALAIFSLAFFGQQSWSTLVMIVPTDLFDRDVIASVAGLVGFGGAMGGLLMNLVAGRLLDAGFGYGTVFNIVGTLHVIAFCVILVAVPRIQPLETS